MCRDQFIISIKKLETNVNLVFVGTKWVEIKFCGIKFNLHFKYIYMKGIDFLRKHIIINLILNHFLKEVSFGIYR